MTKTALQIQEQAQRKLLKQIKKAQKTQKKLDKKLAKERKRELKEYQKERQVNLEYDIAKHGHKQIVKRRKTEKYRKEAEFEKRPKVIQALTKRKGKKRGTSVVGNIIHRGLNPIKPVNLKKRW